VTERTNAIATYTSEFPYESGSLNVTVQGLAPGEQPVVVESDPETGTFTLSAPIPKSSDDTATDAVPKDDEVEKEAEVPEPAPETPAEPEGEDQ
jgi:hypothetical protein